MKNYYEIRGDVTEIYLEKYGMKTLIDTCLLQKVINIGDINWIISVARKVKFTYVTCSVNKKILKLHRVLTDAPEGMVVDHINHDTLDNRLSNLRVITREENSKNTGKYVYEWHKELEESIKNKRNLKKPTKPIEEKTKKLIHPISFDFEKKLDKKVTKKFVALVSNGKVIYQNKPN